jgi:hypothetical protein
MCDVCEDTGRYTVIDPAWQLVPKEPTFEMIKAGVQHELMGDMAGRYKAMLSASPTPPEETWFSMDSAPHETAVLLYSPPVDGLHDAKIEVGWASGGNVVKLPGTMGSHSNRWWHGSATHWMPLPPSPDDRTNDTVAQSESLKQPAALSPSAPREVTLLKEAVETSYATMTALRGLLSSTPAMQSRDFIGMGIKLNDAIDKARAALSSTASGGENG